MVTQDNEGKLGKLVGGREGKSLSSVGKRPVEATLFRFLSRCREKGRRIRRLPSRWKNECKWNEKERFRTSHVDPITVAICGRVSPAISGELEFQIPFP